MLTTEDEAKTKRCQESFPASQGLSIDGAITHTSSPALPAGYPLTSGGGYGVTMATASAPLMCLGSACMAWRWSLPESINAADNIFGYCGKAGRP